MDIQEPKNNTPIEVKLSLPDSSPSGDFTFKNLLIILINKWKTWSLCTAIFFILGIIAVTGYVYLNTRPVQGGSVSAVIKIDFNVVEQGIAPDGRSWSFERLLTADVFKRAVEKSEIGIDPNEIFHNFTVVDIIPPEYVKIAEVYSKQAPTNPVYAERLALLKYYPTQHTITINTSYDISQDTYQSFFGVLVESIADKFNEMYGSYYNANIDFVVSNLDYSDKVLLVMLKMNEINRVYGTGISRKGQYADIMDQLVVISQRIENEKLCKDRDELLSRYAHRAEWYKRSSDEAQMQSDYLINLIASQRQNPGANIPSNVESSAEAYYKLVEQAEMAASDAINYKIKADFYSHSLEVFSQAESTTTNSDVDAMLDSLIAKSDSLITPTEPILLSVPANYIPAPQPSASKSKMFMLIAGITFIGLIFGWGLVLGKIIMFDEKDKSTK